MEYTGFLKYLANKPAIKKINISNFLDIRDTVSNDDEILIRYLIINNYIKQDLIYKELANYFNYKYINIEKKFLDKNILKFSDFKQYVKYKSIKITSAVQNLRPKQNNSKTIFIATSNIDENGIKSETIRWAHKKYGNNLQFVIISPDNLNLVFQKLYKDELTDYAVNSIYHHNNQFSVKKNINSSLLIKILFILIFLGFAILKSSIIRDVFLITINILFLLTLSLKTIGMVTIALINRKNKIGKLQQNFFYQKSPKLESNPMLKKFPNTDNIVRQITDIYNVKNLDRQINPEIDNLSNLPTYTILIPLYKERGNVKNLLHAIHNFDYPKSKLFAKLILEEGDVETYNIVSELNEYYNNFFEIIIVPKSDPQTKPKACNYALQFVHTEYITLYDAEDIPDALQLKKAIFEFQKESNKDLFCVQSQLSYYNMQENLLTQLIYFEYKLWFKYYLKFLEYINFPMQLGGTSYQIKTSSLKRINGWDAYNVTEDAELGCRAFLKQQRCRCIDSITFEEAPIAIKDWVKQRTRWLKGYIQVLLVYCCNFKIIIKKTGIIGIIGFIFSVVVPALNFQLLLINLLLYLIPFERSSLFFYVEHLMQANLIFWILFLYIAMFSLVMNKNISLFAKLKLLLLSPFYLILHIITSYIAIYDLIKRPYYWSKTEHGKSKLLNPK